MSNLKADFSRLVDRAMADPNRTNLRPVVEKELLHYDILFALDRAGLLNGLIFQGGTSLRLCHGSSRFSEDLDFVGGPGFTNASLVKIAETLTKHLGERYGLEVGVKSPRETRDLPDYQGMNVDRWQVSVMTSPGRPDLPRQRIKLEVVNIPAHQTELLPLQRNYDFLPSGYEDMLIRVETREEIMADKLVSFPAALSTHPRHRDLWDLQWMSQRQTKPRIDLVLRKVDDYRIEDYRERLDYALSKLDEVVFSDAFRDEMVRFLPADRVAATFGKEGFLTYMSGNLSSLFEEVKSALGPEAEPDRSPFAM